MPFVPSHTRLENENEKALISIETSAFFNLLDDGGDKRDRTADLLNAIQALSQLSYTPICILFVCPRTCDILT